MIRDACESDLPFLAEGMVRLQNAHADAFPHIYQRFDERDATSYLSDLLSRSDTDVRVVVHANKVVGHAVFVVQTTPECMFKHAQRYGHLTQIEVEPDFRRRGYGRMLLADCEQIAASYGLNRIVLDVWAFNDSAKSYFKANGYSDFASKLLRSV